MKKISKYVAVLTLLAIVLSAVPCSADMITPITSTTVTCDNTTNWLKSGAGSRATNWAVASDPKGSGDKCLYLGDSISTGGYGIACGGDVWFTVENGSGNHGNGCIQAIYGEGTFAFDILVKRPTDAEGKASFMYLYNESSKKIGDIRFTDKTTWVEVKPNQSESSKYPAATVTSHSNGNRIEFDTWYTCLLSVDMKTKSWDFEMKEKGETATVVAVGAVGYHADGAATLGFRDLRFEIANAKRPRFYVDNWVTKREAFIVGTPTLASDGTNYTANVAIKNESTVLETIPTLIVATYDNQGKLVAVNWANAFDGNVKRNSVLDAAPTEVNLSCSVPVGTAATAKAFVWNSLSTLVPYTTPVNPQ